MDSPDEPMPIAVIGVACRFSGDATNPEKFWDMLVNGRGSRIEIPKDRMNTDAFYHPNCERQGAYHTRYGHFIEEDVAAFDAPFFTISAQEAKSMDPQQRLALEIAYETFENAGIRMSDVAASQTACYVGTCTQDYYDLLVKDPEVTTQHAATGIGKGLLACRLSWFYDLRGPSLTVDTACSSALVGLHLACQSLRTGESKQALVAGTNLMLAPDTMIWMSSLHALSAEGQCHTFDRNADGYARGEGLACIMVKPLADAIRDNDVIRAVVRGTAVNQDGGTAGITVPSSLAQIELIKSAYQNAKIGFDQTGYFEAHGTGTVVGDLQETSAMAATFGKTRSRDNPLWIGSSKTNIGHMEGASGLGGLIKAIYSLEKGVIAPNVSFEEAPSSIPLEEWNLKVPTTATPWPLSGIRRVSVNGFGFGGTNAHAVLDDAYHYLKAHGLEGKHNCVIDHGAESPRSQADSGIGLSPPSTSGSDDEARPENSQKTPKSKISSPGMTPKLLVWSSNEKKGLNRTITALTDYINKKTEAGLEANFLDRLSYTLSKRRNLFLWRTFASVSSLDNIASQVEQSLAPPARAKMSPSLGLVFTGQGAQWYAMGRELSAYQVFQQSISDTDAYLKSIGSTWSVLEELSKDKQTSKINQPDLSQALCTALQVALIDLLRHWNITPKAVVGHSSGEIAAAYAKGAISKQYALKAAYFRGLYASQLKQIAPELDGGMLAVGVGEDVVAPYLESFKDKASIACYNSPASVTVSGDVGSLDELAKSLTKDGIFARKLMVTMAYHSSHMGRIAELYRAAISDEKPLDTDSSSVHMMSSVTGLPLQSSDLIPEYWVSNLTSPVRFDQAVQKIMSSDKTSVDLFLEIGPHGALQGPLKQILATKSADIPCSSLLTRGQDAVSTTLEAMGRLFQYGAEIDIDLVNQPKAAGRTTTPTALVDLPPYPWNHENKYWHETSISKDIRFRKNPRHNLLGALLPGSTPFAPVWRHHLRVSESPWLEDHRVQKTILFPAAGMLVMAIQAIWEVSEQCDQADGFELRDVRIAKGLVIPADELGIETMVQLTPKRIGTSSDSAVWQEFTVSSRSDTDAWAQHCSGLVRLKLKSGTTSEFQDEDEAEAAALRSTYEAIKINCTKSEAPRQFYESLATVGYQYGPTFRNLTKVTYGDLQSVCTVKIPDTKSGMPNGHEFPHKIHPAFLDSIFHMMLPTLMPGGLDMSAVGVPTFFEYIYVSADISKTPGDELLGYSRAIPPLSRETDGEIVVADAEWKKPQVIIRNLRCTTVSSSSDNDALSRKLGSRLVWKSDVAQVQRSSLVKSEAAMPDPSEAEELELAAFTFVKHVLKEIKPEETKNFAHYLQMFYSYCEHQYQLALQQKHEHQTGSIDWINTPPEYEADLLARVKASSIDGRLLCTHGEHLVEIVRGQREALEVLTIDDMLDKYYSGHIGWDVAHQPLSNYLDLLAHKNPELRILDIGAGTGGTTFPLLQKLSGHNGGSPRFRQYTYTDISPGFFGRAAEKFAAWAPYMNFQKLDISEDPSNQGFEPQSYDVIIASNCLHATRSIDETLTNTRSLLKPGGKLLLYEITHGNLLTIPMIFGTLPGWWVGEADGRKLGPCITEGQWSKALTKAGFSGIDISVRNSPSERDYITSVMVSTRSVEETKPELPKEVFIITPNDGPQQAALSLCANLHRVLKDTGVECSTLTASAACSAATEKKWCVVALEADQPILSTLDQTTFETIQSVILRSQNILWLTKGANRGEVPEAALMAGFARTIRAENPGITLTLLDLDPSAAIDHKDTTDSIVRVLGIASATKDDECPDAEYAIRDGTVLIPRLTPDDSTNDMLASTTSQRDAVLSKLKMSGRRLPLKLQVGTPGMLNTLQFVSDPVFEKTIAADEVEIEVKATGLSSKDSLIASGQVSIDELGFECSGIVTRIGTGVTKFVVGEKVVTWQVNDGCFREYVRNSESCFLPIQEGMSFETAASLPAAYGTAYYALVLRAHLQKNESVLIHNGAGAVGHAAINVARHAGAEVFTTVASAEEKQIVCGNGIAADHVFSSTDLGFAKGIKRVTNGRGVDVVLNSLTGEALRQTWHCIAPFGRFVELGQMDINGNTGLDMAPFRKNVTFMGLNLLDLCREDAVLASKVFAEVWELLRLGKLAPVQPVTTMTYSQVEEAFQLMQADKEVGKVVLTLNDEDQVMVVPEDIRAAQFDANSTYVLVGAAGGLGPKIAMWMVEHGVKNLVTISRSGDSKKEAKELIATLSARGVTVKTFACDISDAASLSAVISSCDGTLPPIKGVIHGGMVLQDSVFENMTNADFTAAIRPKVQGSWNLHNLLPKDMDFFVCLSSMCGMVGNRAQGNYAAASSYQDALALYRRNLGLAACTIDIGIILGVGWVAENVENKAMSYLKTLQYLGMRIEEFLLILQAAVTGQTIDGLPTPAHLSTGLGTGGLVQQRGADEPFWFGSPLFKQLRIDGTHVRSGSDDSESSVSVQSLLAKTTAMSEATAIVTDAIAHRLAKQLTMSVEDLDSGKSVSRSGVDSLIAVELRNWMFRELGADLSMFEILADEPMALLAGKIAKMSKFLPEALKEGAGEDAQ